MTKFFLFGGGLIPYLKKNVFIKQLRLKNSIHNILVFPYAKENREWDSILQTFTQIIHEKSPEVKVHLATLDVPDLLRKINLCDIFIFTGGSEILLKNTFSSLEIDLKNILRDKIVLGNSAGSNVFSEIYYSNDRDTIEEGLGICPIKLICHYNETKKAKIALLQEFEPVNLPIFALQDEQFAEYEF